MESLEEEFESVEYPSKKRKYYLISFTIIVLASILTVSIITYRGYYPWGPDVWGHIFKAKVLYENVKQGILYPLYTDLWYNGVQPFRYWAPLCYYIIMFFCFFTKGDIVLAYYGFMLFIFIFQAFGWILWGYKSSRLKLGVILSLLWFFMPDNLSIFIAAGNLPRATANAFFPYLFFFFWSYLVKRNRKSLIGIYFCMIFISLSHLMIAAMTGITLFLYVTWYGIINKKYMQIIEIVGIALLGVITTGLWFIPALKGGMLNLDQDAVLEFTAMLTYPIKESLNPFFRDKNIECFYFGISVFIIAIIGFLFSNKKSRVGFGITLIIFLGTTKAFLPFTSHMPMSQMFWMMRFTPLAMASFFTGLILWRELKKKVLICFLCLIVIDCAWGFKAIGYGRPLSEVKPDLDKAVKMSNQKVAMLDLSEFGSYPSYYLSNNDENKRIGQLYGWAFQGAQTSSNIVSINSAIETGWYTYVFDRSLEMGADTLVVKKDNIKSEKLMMEASQKIGYELKDETEYSWIFKYPVEYTFGTKAKYDGLGIGKYSVNISYMFPKIEIGSSQNIDDYSEEKLLNYKVIYLSGFHYKDKKKAENLIKSISVKGVNVIIDLTGSDTDVYSSRNEFLDVIAQPINFNNNYPKLIYKNKEYYTKDFPTEYKKWNTNYLQNLDKVEGTATLENQIVNFCGTKYNSNIHFIGFNIPFYSQETKDNSAIKVMEELFGMKVYDSPKREIVPISIENGKNKINIKSNVKNTTIPIANLDSFVYVKGRSDAVNNLIFAKDTELSIEMKYPYLYKGLFVSIIGLIGVIVSYKFYFTKILSCKGEDINARKSI